MATDKKVGTGASTGPANDTPGQKRPHATLDLTATDVTEPTPNAADTTADEPATGRATGDTDETIAKPEPQPDARREPRRGSGSLFSHLLAGVAGGLLSLAIVEWAAPSLGIQTPTQGVQRQANDLQARLANLEAATRGSDVAAKLQAAEDRLAKLETSSGDLAAAQAKLGEEARALSETVAANPIAEQTEKRLAALDERLATIATAAERNGTGGDVGHVVALTGKVKDLQDSVSADIDALRKSLPKDVDERVTKLAEQSQAAQEGMARVDRDLGEAKLEATRQTQRLETIKADLNRTSAVTRVLQEETGKLTSGFEELKATVAQQVQGGVGAAVTPMTSKIARLEADVSGLAKSEQARKEDAERIILSLELANLKRTIDSGQSYAGGLEAVKVTAGDKLDLKPLDPFKDTGVATLADLQSGFRPVAHAMIDAAVTPVEGGVMDKLIAGAKSVVRVRNLNPSPDDKSVEAIVARMQGALAVGQLGDVLARAKDLPPPAAAVARDWLAKVEARHAVDQAIGDIEGQLKASLTTTGGAAAPPVTPAADAPKVETPRPQPPAANPATDAPAVDKAQP